MSPKRALSLRFTRYIYWQERTLLKQTPSMEPRWISQTDYDLQKYAYRMNYEVARLARISANKVTAAEKGTPEGRWRLVAGAIGPTNRTASVSPKVDDASFRNVTYNKLFDAYYEQIEGFVDGGAHIYFVETVFDTLNARAAVYAYNEYLRTQVSLLFLYSFQEQLSMLLEELCQDRMLRLSSFP